MKTGTTEKVAMAISRHKTRAVFDHYHIVDKQDVVSAMRRVQGPARVQFGANPQIRAPKPQLKP